VISALDGGMFVALVLELIIQDDPFRTSLSAKVSVNVCTGVKPLTILGFLYP
jgi:hypothetical protein